MAAGLTQGKLAKKAGVTRASINRLERNNNPPTRLRTLRAIARALGIPVASVLPPEPPTR